MHNTENIFNAAELCTSKMVIMVTFMLCLFYLQKATKKVCFVPNINTLEIVNTLTYAKRLTYFCAQLKVFDSCLFEGYPEVFFFLSR